MAILAAMIYRWGDHPSTDALMRGRRRLLRRPGWAWGF